MAKIFIYKILILLLFFGSTEAQTLIDENLNASNNYQRINSLSFINTSSTLTNIFKEGYQPINLALNQNYERPDADYIEFTIPVSAKENIILQLFKNNSISNNIKILDADNKEFKIDSISLYSGRIKGKPNSLCGISFTNNNINGFIADGKRNLNIKKINTDQISIYDEAQLLNQDVFTCNILKTAKKETKSFPTVSGVGCKVVDIYVEADNAFYIQNGSNLTNATTAVITLFNQVATLYQNDNMEIRVTGIKIWNTLQPYTGSDESSILTSIRTTNAGSFIGNLFHYLRGTSGGGVAYLDVLNVKSYAYGVSSVPFGGYVNGSFTTSAVSEVAHELGHNFGSEHTHWCGWPGGPIDNCSDVDDGPCAAGPSPTAGGTIMSYCHILSSVGINLANGFGTLPGNLMRANVIATTLPASPSAPTTTPAVACTGTGIGITASGCTGGTLRWYASATGGTPLATINIYNTPVLSSNVTYHVSCFKSSCESPRVPLTITVSSPPVPISFSTIKCGTGPLTLSVSNCTGGTVEWFSSTSSTAILSTGANYTPTIIASVTYYAHCKIGTCNSSRTGFIVNLVSKPPVPTVNNISVPAGFAHILTVSGCSNPYKWLANTASTTVLSSINTYTTPVLNVTTPYVIQCTGTSPGCDSNFGTLTVTISSCPGAITFIKPLNNLTGLTNTYRTVGLFKATNEITGGNINYFSKKSIELNPGFITSGNTVFRASIQDCPIVPLD